MMQPKALFFDWDGTLVDTLDFVFTAHNHVREAMGFTRWTRDEFREHTKFSSRQLYPRIYGTRAQEAMDVLERFMDDNHLKPENLVLLNGSRDILSVAHNAGIPMAVISNKRDQFVNREVDHMGLRPYFASVIGAGVAESDKPSAAPLLYALNAAGITPGPDVWYVGDTEPDVLCAHAAGCTAVLLHHDKDHAALITTHKPEMVLKDVLELVRRMA